MKHVTDTMGAAMLSAFLSLSCGASENHQAGQGKVTGASFVIEYVFTPATPRVGDNEAHLHLEDRSGGAVIGATIIAEPWMEAHGHGSVNVPKVIELGAGEYHLMDLVFQMPGKWSIELEIITTETTETLEIELEVE